MKAHPTTPRSGRAEALIPVLALLLTACGGGGSGGGGGPIGTLTVNGGATQTALAGTTLPTPLSVRITDGSGSPIASQTVVFMAVTGGGSVSPTTVETDSNGVAKSHATLGTAAGENTFSAQAVGSSVEFKATADAVPATPPARSEAGLAFDESRNVTLLFGGLADNSTLADTWTFNGSSWELRKPRASPEGRSGHAMIYNNAFGGVFLFGGSLASGGVSNQTWLWNGVDWIQSSPATSPPARTGHALAYDSVARSMVLFGGLDASSNPLGDTWEYRAGTGTWRQLTPATSPSARGGHAMAYDPIRRVIVLFGGGQTFLGDTWEWNGTNWVSYTPSPAPPGRSGHAMAYNSAQGGMVLFGGGGSGGTLGDTWAWGGPASGWGQVAVGSSPSARSEHGLVFDFGRNRNVLFGGTTANVRLGDTWDYLPSAWTQK